MEGIPNNNEALKIELYEIFSKAHSKDILGVHQKVVDKSNDLKLKYPDFFDYELYHMMIGSTLVRPVSNFDFPGEDSIEKFIRSL